MAKSKNPRSRVELKGRRLGRVLTKMGLVTRQIRFTKALALQQHPSGAPIGQLLIELGYCQPSDDVNTALAAQAGHGVDRSDLSWT